MITLGLFIVIGAIAVIVTFLYWTFEDDSIGAGIVFAAIVAGVFTGGYFGVAHIITMNADEYVTESKVRHELIALDTGTDASGRSYFLGGAHYQSGPAYTYLVQNPDGAFNMQSVYAANALVYERDQDEAYMIESEIRPKSRLWSIHTVNGMRQFFVPTGTVEKDKFRVSVER